MKNSRPVVSLIFLILLGETLAWTQNPPVNLTENQKFSYGAETNFNSNYVWRGILIDSGPVLQPSAWVSRSDFTVIAWSNLKLAQPLQNRRLDATDLILMYERDWKNLVIRPSLEAYIGRPSVNAQDSNTLESALNLSYPVGPFRLFTEHALDLLAYRGAYFGQAGAIYERRLTKKTAFGVTVHSGWASSKFNAAHIGVQKPAFNFVGVKGTFTYHLSQSVYLQPHVELDNTIDRQLRQLLPSPTVLSVGLEVGFEL